MTSRVACVVASCLLVLGAASCGDSDEEQTDSTTAAETIADEQGQTTPAEPSEQPQGDERDGSGAEPTEQLERPLAPEDVITAVLTAAGPPEQVCDELVTERFLRTAYGSRQGCVAAAGPGARAKSVEISQVEESGAEASAVAVPTGGPYDGIEVEVELVADPELEGAWLLDSLVADVPPGP